MKKHKSVLHKQKGPDSQEMHALWVLFNEGQYAEAAALAQKMTARFPMEGFGWTVLGAALKQTGRKVESLQAMQKSAALTPSVVEVHYNLGVLLHELGRLAESEASYRRALQLKPDYAAAHYNLGITLYDMGKLDASEASYRQALLINPEYAEAFHNLGFTLRDLKRFDEALACYDRTLRLKPDYVEALINRGNVLRDLIHFEDALASYDHALRLKPDQAAALENRGFVLLELKRHRPALESFEHALKLEPDRDFLYGAWLATKMKICDWSNLEDQLNLLTEKIGRDACAASPFPVIAMSGSPALQRKAAEIWVGAKCPAVSVLPEIGKRPRRDKIHIGYFSSDWHNHATAYLMAELFEMHDKSKFVITAFSFGPVKNDEMRTRLVAAFDNFIDVRGQSDKDVAILSREIDIDIAVDLKGFTYDSRAGIFAMRAAPLQINYLGYPGTMGAEYIDYVIADPILIPESHRENYREKVAYLPNSYQVNDAKRRISDSDFSRAKLGLPQTGFVFCCFNNSYKIVPDIFDRWMRILKQVEGSVLWLLWENAEAASNLCEEAARRGIGTERLVFAKRMELSGHLARHRFADLFLDTLPYNAHTTASDALWAGLPVLTCLGDTFAGRVAASLLTAIDLPELIAPTPDAYEALAVKLASNPGELAHIRKKLDRNRLTTPLFDCQRFTRNIEALYTAMYERYDAGLAPDNLVLEQ